MYRDCPAAPRSSNERMKGTLLAKDHHAMIGEQKIVCPTCSHDRFYAKPHTISTSGLQILNWEIFGKQGVMLICGNCSRIQQFARTDTISLIEDTA